MVSVSKIEVLDGNQVSYGLGLTSILVAEESRKHLHSTLTTLGSQIDADLRDRITTIHQNAQSLETQTLTLKKRTAALSKTTRQWSGMAESARSRLKVSPHLHLWGLDFIF